MMRSVSQQEFFYSVDPIVSGSGTASILLYTAGF